MHDSSNRLTPAHLGLSGSLWSGDALDSPFEDEEVATLPSKSSRHEVWHAPKRPWALVRKRRGRKVL